MTRKLASFLAIGLMVLLPRYGMAEWGDIVFTRKTPTAEGDYPPATFPHYVHRIQFRCYVCHEEIVQMKAGANAITMDAISEGKFCGVCHNETRAFGNTFEACQRCHRP